MHTDDMEQVMYAQLISLLDIYERNKKDCAGHDDYVYYSGACDALKKLKRKMEFSDETKGTI